MEGQMNSMNTPFNGIKNMGATATSSAQKPGQPAIF